MLASVRALLEHLIDYAGLFPPARLPLDESIRNFAAYRSCAEAWMLGRFICPAARLSELAPFDAELFRESPPLRFSALGRAGDADAWLSDLSADLADIQRFQERHAGRVRVEALEVKPPPAATASAGGLTSLLTDLRATLARSGLAELPVFLEVAQGADASVRAVCEALAADNHRHPTPLGFKLRTGGLEAAAFPRVADVALVIEQCRDHRVPLKFTAGLHHPLRHFDAGVYAHMHGFLNVFIAAVLAHAVGFDQHDLMAVIEAPSFGEFHFAEEHLGWNDGEVTTDDIRSARRALATSFGSCSFDEPRDDLRRLGLLSGPPRGR